MRRDHGHRWDDRLVPLARIAGSTGWDDVGRRVESAVLDRDDVILSQFRRDDSTVGASIQERFLDVLPLSPCEVLDGARSESLSPAGFFLSHLCSVILAVLPGVFSHLRSVFRIGVPNLVGDTVILSKALAVFPIVPPTSRPAGFSIPHLGRAWFAASFDSVPSSLVWTEVGDRLGDLAGSASLHAEIVPDRRALPWH